MKKLLALVSLGVGLCAIIPVSVSAVQGQVESTTFTQQILPLNCIFVTVDTGLNTIRYLTPKECGQIISPSQQNNSTDKSSTSSNNLAPQPQNGASNSSFMPKTSAIPFKSQAMPITQSKQPRRNEPTAIIINNHEQALTINGYDITVSMRQKLIFIPLLTPAKEQHELVITGIDNGGVTLTQDSNVRQTELKSNQINSLDPSVVGHSTIAIEVIGKPNGKTAHLRIWLVNSKLTLREVLQTNNYLEKHIWAFISVMSLAVIVAGTRFWYRHHRK